MLQFNFIFIAETAGIDLCFEHAQPVADHYDLMKKCIKRNLFLFCGGIARVKHHSAVVPSLPHLGYLRNIAEAAENPHKAFFNFFVSGKIGRRFHGFNDFHPFKIAQYLPDTGFNKPDFICIGAHLNYHPFTELRVPHP